MKKNSFKLITIAVLLIVLGILAMSLSSCRQSDRVSYNLSKEADSFNVARKLTVINVRTDTILFQMTGNFSIETGSDGDLEVTGENDNGTYYKHFVRMSQEITYVVEDLGRTSVSKNKFEIIYNPEMWVPVEIVPTE